MMTRTDQETASFGFRDVAASEKAGLVRAVFDSVADNYDVMNDAMSGGVHRLWKSVLLDRLAPQRCSRSRRRELTLRGPSRIAVRLGVKI